MASICACALSAAALLMTLPNPCFMASPLRLRTRIVSHAWLPLAADACPSVALSCLPLQCIITEAPKEAAPVAPGMGGMGVFV